MAFTELKPAHGYARRPPTLHNFQAADTAGLRHLLAQVAQPAASCPAEGFTVLDHCYVYDGCYVMTPDGEWMADTVADYGIAEVIKPVIQDVIRGRHHSWLAPSPFQTVVIAKAGFDNHGHVLTDILPKLVNVARSGFRGIRLLLPAAMQRYEGTVTALLDSAGIAVELEYHVPATLREAHGVAVFSPTGRHNDRKSTTFLELADRLRAVGRVRPERTRRLYVRRAQGDYRTLQNAAEVEAAFAAHGFEAVFPGALPLPEQVALFASASHVAGAMGAGLANIGWAAPGCEVLMIDPGIGDAYFWDFACLLQQRFHWLFAAPFTGYTPDLVHAHYGVDGDLLRGTLRALFG